MEADWQGCPYCPNKYEYIYGEMACEDCPILEIGQCAIRTGNAVVFTAGEDGNVKMSIKLKLNGKVLAGETMPIGNYVLSTIMAGSDGTGEFRGDDLNRAMYALKGMCSSDNRK